MRSLVDELALVLFFFSEWTYFGFLLIHSLQPLYTNTILSSITRGVGVGNLKQYTALSGVDKHWTQNYLQCHLYSFK
jgi:hypothetical protein